VIGRRIGSWVLQREIGRGGMGSVFKAEHVSLHTPAAVKVLSPGVEAEESFRRRFQREAELQAQLRHPNVARVLDYLEDDGHWFLIIDYLDRGSLGDLLARGESVPHIQALEWTRQALAGLGHAHAHGIVHRDIKPANLLLADNGELVVADFGIARGNGAAGLTTTGAVVGTPHYMSPEQIVTPERVDRRSDIYSLGIVLYEMLAGQKPFDAPSQFAVLQAQVSTPPPPLHTIDSSISPDLEAVVVRALSKNPADRYDDCASMARDLDRRPHVPPTSGATLHASVLFQRQQAANPDVSSARSVRDNKRATFQRRLITCAAVTLVAAALFAFHMAKYGTPADVPVVHDVSTSAVGTNPPTVPRPHSPPSPDSQPPKQVGTHRQLPLPIPEQQRPDVPLQPPTSGPMPQTARPSAPMPLPARPRIAVIGTGDDPLLAGALEQEMERRLAPDVADEQAEPEIAELLRAKGASLGVQELGAALLKSGFHILVLLRVEKGESRTKTIEGISGSIKASRMRLSAYMLPTRRPIGNGWTEGAEYTELSAAATAHKAFIGATADLREALETDWGRLRTGGGAL
jgi:serine/threonine protein kinase